MLRQEMGDAAGRVIFAAGSSSNIAGERTTTSSWSGSSFSRDSKAGGATASTSTDKGTVRRIIPAYDRSDLQEMNSISTSGRIVRSNSVEDISEVISSSQDHDKYADDPFITWADNSNFLRATDLQHLAAWALTSEITFNLRRRTADELQKFIFAGSGEDLAQVLVGCSTTSAGQQKLTAASGGGRSGTEEDFCALTSSSCTSSSCSPSSSSTSPLVAVQPLNPACTLGFALRQLRFKLSEENFEEVLAPKVRRVIYAVVIRQLLLDGVSSTIRGCKTRNDVREKLSQLQKKLAFCLQPLDYRRSSSRCSKTQESSTCSRDGDEVEEKAHVKAGSAAGGHHQVRTEDAAAVSTSSGCEDAVRRMLKRKRRRKTISVAEQDHRPSFQQPVELPLKDFSFSNLIEGDHVGGEEKIGTSQHDYSTTSTPHGSRSAPPTPHNTNCVGAPDDRFFSEIQVLLEELERTTSSSQQTTPRSSGPDIIDSRFHNIHTFILRHAIPESFVDGLARVLLLSRSERHQLVAECKNGYIRRRRTAGSSTKADRQEQTGTSSATSCTSDLSSGALIFEHLFRPLPIEELVTLDRVEEERDDKPPYELHSALVAAGGTELQTFLEGDGNTERKQGVHSCASRPLVSILQKTKSGCSASPGRRSEGYELSTSFVFRRRIEVERDGAEHQKTYLRLLDDDPDVSCWREVRRHEALSPCVSKVEVVSCTGAALPLPASELHVDQVAVAGEEDESSTTTPEVGAAAVSNQPVSVPPGASPVTWLIHFPTPAAREEFFAGRQLSRSSNISEGRGEGGLNRGPVAAPTTAKMRTSSFRSTGAGDYVALKSRTSARLLEPLATTTTDVGDSSESRGTPAAKATSHELPHLDFRDLFSLKSNADERELGSGGDYGSSRAGAPAAGGGRSKEPPVVFSKMSSKMMLKDRLIREIVSDVESKLDKDLGPRKRDMLLGRTY
ncbi:unnamed protein product [Amoebophrya sp. A120]|nr:unnamed protein product [Amoebophrya sp. A120]|eukprot:GSA120T00018145001.1